MSLSSVSRWWAGPSIPRVALQAFQKSIPSLIAILIDIWSRSASKIDLKSIKKQSKNRCCFQCRFQIDVWLISGASKPWKRCFHIGEALFFIKSLVRESYATMISFWSNKLPEINQNSIKNHINNYITIYIDCWSKFDWACLPKSRPKSLQWDETFARGRF